jgi:hypothetical protein
LLLPFQYIFSLIVFVNKNRELFLSNSEIHEINTRYNQNLHLPSTNFTLVQKGVLYSGSKIYNRLPLSIKAHSNDAKRFKTTLKSYLIEHVLYSLDGYYQFQWLWFLFIWYTLIIYFFYFNCGLIAVRYYVTCSVTCSYFYTLINFCLSCFVSCVATNALHTSVYFYVQLWMLLYL